MPVAYAYGYSHGNIDANCYGHCNLYADGNGYLYTNINANCYGYCNSDGNRNVYANSYCYSNGNAYVFTNANAHSAVPMAHNRLLSAGGYERCSQYG